MPTLPIGDPGAPPADFLYFNFPANWEAVEFDRDKHAPTGQTAGFYRHTILSEGVEHIRGVDIVARPTAEMRLQLIEVKDDRKRTLPASDRHEELRKTVLNKVLGTLAGLTVAERVGEPTLRSLACLSQRPAIDVVLFLEEPPVVVVPNVGSKRALRRQTRSVFRSSLEQNLMAKLATWGLPFYLYNLSNRQPAEWVVQLTP